MYNKQNLHVIKYQAKMIKKEQSSLTSHISLLNVLMFVIIIMIIIAVYQKAHIIIPSGESLLAIYKVNTFHKNS